MIADMTGITVAAVETGLAELTKLGLILREVGGTRISFTRPSWLTL